MRVDWNALSERELLAHCEEDRYRASGPGGQKRNKIESAIRLRHLPTNIIVTATESRSQHENRQRAIRRLREALCFQYRQPTTETPPDSVRTAVAAGKLALSPKDPRFLEVAAWTLDLLEENQGAVAATAEQLGVTTANLVGFYRSSPGMWREVQEIRGGHGLKPLR
jgi:hypothetical protein